MRVGLVTDSIEMGSPGLRRYSMRLAEAMLDLQRADVTLIHRGAGADPFYQGKRTLRVRDAGVPFAGKQLMFPPQTAGRGFDILHDTYHFPPFLAPLPYKKVMSVADLTALFLPTHRLRNRAAHQVLFPWLVRRADHIVTISEYTRRDLIARLGVAPDKVTSTPLAADSHLRPVDDKNALEAVRRKYRLPARFLLYVGTIEPRKNLPRLLDAFARIAADQPELELVLAGPAGWGDTRLYERAASLGIEHRVRLIGRVDEADLAALYSLATAFVFPSLYEGFGLPPLEAMQCGCPVITSNVSSLPEVVGDAALTVDPTDTAALSAAILRVCTDEALRARMRDAGLRQAVRFSWKRCAEQTFAVYEGLLATTPRWRLAA